MIRAWAGEFLPSTPSLSERPLGGGGGTLESGRRCAGSQPDIATHSMHIIGKILTAQTLGFPCPVYNPEIGVATA
jgi:hypothetical protein